MQKYLTSFLFVVVAFALVVAQTQAESNRLETREDAYNKAIEITGFNSKQFPLNNMAAEQLELSVLQQGNIPYLADSVIDKEVWQIRFDNVKLDLPGWAGSWIENQIEKDYSVFLDAGTGRLIQITGRSDTAVAFFYDSIYRERGDRLLSNSGERYTGFPDSLPPVTFEKALEAAVFSSPLMAEEIHAVCAYWAHLEKEPKLVWMITANGVPYSEILRTTQVRTIIDAETGKLLSGGTSP